LEISGDALTENLRCNVLQQLLGRRLPWQDRQVSGSAVLRLWDQTSCSNRLCMS